MVDVSDVITSLNELDSDGESTDLSTIESEIDALESSLAAVKTAYNDAVPYIVKGARVHEIFYALANTSGATSSVAQGFQAVAQAIGGTTIQTEVTVNAVN